MLRGKVHPCLGTLSPPLAVAPGRTFTEFTSPLYKKRSGRSSALSLVQEAAVQAAPAREAEGRLERLRSPPQPAEGLSGCLLSLFQPLGEILRQPGILLKPSEGPLEVVFNAAKVDRRVIDDDVGSS